MTSKITQVLKIEDTIYFETNEDDGRWYPALVEVDFEGLIEPEIKINNQTNLEIIVHVTLDEWRQINKFIEEQVSAYTA